MDAVKFIKEKYRMCGTTDCLDCEVYRGKNEMVIDCYTLINKYPEEAVAIVEKWSQEHPLKTMLSDLLEKYPNST